MSMELANDFNRLLRNNNPVLGHSVDEHGFSFEVYPTWKPDEGKNGEIHVTAILRARDESGKVHDMAHILETMPIEKMPQDFGAAEILACLVLWRCWTAMLRHPALTIEFKGLWGGNALAAL